MMATQESSQLFLLRSVDGEQQLLVDRELVIGRDPASDVRLDQGGVSRRHARVTPGDGGIWVEDIGSTNGTLVNGERIDTARLLIEGDRLEVGKAVFTLLPKAPEVGSDPDATQLYIADRPDSDATALHSDTEATPGGDSPAEPAPTPPEPEKPDSRAPPSWVLNNQQSVDGTALFSKDSLQNSLRNSENNRTPQQAVSEPTLVGNSEPIVGMRFQLIGDNKNQWEIGRSPNADVMLNHESVSSAHAQIIHDAGSWKVVDLMSANGTYANGKKCLTGYLSSGDTVCFGSVECAFMLPDDEQQPGHGAGSKASTNASESGIKTAVLAFLVTAAVAGIALFIVGRFL